MISKFAAFDIDGTLIRWQLYHSLVDKLAKQNLLGEDAHNQLHEARMKWKRRESNDEFLAYEAQVIKVYEAAIQKINFNDFDKAVEEVVQEYKDQVYTYTKKLIADLKNQGYFLLAISGSHQELVEKIANYYGFDDCLGTVYQRGETSFSGQKTVASKNKQRALSWLIQKHNLTLKGSYAVGDSKSDALMLEMVEKPIVFNPDTHLYNIALKKHWPVVIERKNVVYRLNYNHGQYLLA